MLHTTAEPIGEYSRHARDRRFAEGRLVVALAVLSFLAMAAVALAVILAVWR
jgi:hypothetical protein